MIDDGLNTAIGLQVDAFLAECNDTGRNNVELEYSTEDFMPGVYVFELKGSISHRLEMLGSASPGQTELSQNQMTLRRIACAQNQSFTVTYDWRQVVTDFGTYVWGPDRPTFTNGAPCYLMHRDAGIVEDACRAGCLKLMSKHVIASAEYIPLIIAALNDDTYVRLGRERYLFSRAGHPERVYWYRYRRYWSIGTGTDTEQLLSPELAAGHLALANLCRVARWGPYKKIETVYQ